MNSSVISPKYQIVIPEEIRSQLNLTPGQRMQFEVSGERIEIRRVLTGDELMGFLKGPKPLNFERDKDRL